MIRASKEIAFSLSANRNEFEEDFGGVVLDFIGFWRLQRAQMANTSSEIKFDCHFSLLPRLETARIVPGRLVCRGFPCFARSFKHSVNILGKKRGRSVSLKVPCAPPVYITAGAQGPRSVSEHRAELWSSSIPR